MRPVCAGGARSQDGRAAPGRENGREAPPRAAHKASGIGLAKSAKLAKPARMRAGLLRTSLRFPEGSPQASLSSRTGQGCGLDIQSFQQGGVALFGQTENAPVGPPFGFPRHAPCSAPDPAATSPCFDPAFSRSGRSRLLIVRGGSRPAGAAFQGSQQIGHL